jgi:hypothetical protein
VDTPLGRIIGRRTLYQPLEEDCHDDSGEYTATDLSEDASQSSMARWIRRQTSTIRRLLHQGARIVTDSDLDNRETDGRPHRRGVFTSLIQYLKRLLVKGVRSGVNFVSLRSKGHSSKSVARTLSFLGIPYALPPVGKLRCVRVTT